jgi:uncharacterized protein YdaU (DUF1376 family)
MNGLPYFAFYASDFLSGVAAMPLEDRGAYITLLCHQWVNGTIPDDLPACVRICGGGTVSERVLGKFQNVEGTNTRANARLEREREKCLLARDKAKKRKTKWTERNRNAFRNGSGTVPDTSQERSGSDSDSLLPLGKRDIREPGKAKGPYSEDFESFWTAYPRKVGKGAAWKAWKAAKTKPVQETILSAVQAAKRSDQWTKDGGQFIPHPATWINQGRWDDVHAAPMPQSAQGQPQAEKPRGTWDIEKQLEVLRSERDRLNRSDFETTEGRARYPEQFAKLQEINRQIQGLRNQIAGKT